MEKEKKEIKISLWTFYVLMAGIVVLIAGVIIGGLNVARQESNKPNGEMLGNNGQEQQQVADDNKVEQLNVNSELVQKLYGYVRTEYPLIGLGFYREQKMTVSSLEDDMKLLTVLYAMLNEKQYNIVKKETLRTEYDEYFESEVPVIDLDERVYLDLAYNGSYDFETTKYITAEANAIGVTEDVYEFELNDIQEMAKRIFNTTINIQGHSFEAFAESFVYDDNMYKFIQTEGGGGTEWWSASRIIKAESKGKEIYIYDNYIKEVMANTYDAEIEGHEYAGFENVYSTSNEKLKITERIYSDTESVYNIVEAETYPIVLVKNAEQILNTTLPQYKHTFKQADNGEYYWVSTELVNKDELKIVENIQNTITGKSEIEIILNEAKQYQNIVDRTNLYEILEGVGLPVAVDDFDTGAGYYLLGEPEILGNLIRIQNTDVTNIPNELIVKMGFNLLYANQLSKDIDFFINANSDNMPIGTIPSLDSEKEDYTGQVVILHFGEELLREYITKIFGENIRYENEDYILLTTCKEFDGPWTDIYAKYNEIDKSYTLYYPFEPFGEAWNSLHSVITDVNEQGDKLNITMKVAFVENKTSGECNYYAEWIPTISKYQSVLKPEMLRNYEIGSYGILHVNNKVLTESTGNTDIRKLCTETILSQLPTYKYTFKFDGITGKYYFESFKTVK